MRHLINTAILLLFVTLPANAAVFSSVELVDWMLGFSKGK